MGGRSGPCTPRSEGCIGQAFFFEAEVQKMRVEMASMKRDAEHSLRQEHMELEKLYRELTDLLVSCRMHVQITQIDEAKNDLVLSEKEAWELLYLKEGTLVEGTVKKIFPYGAQVRIG
ncbi:hypothetical protein COP2_020631 [Malus domestica]